MQSLQKTSLKSGPSCTLPEPFSLQGKARQPPGFVLSLFEVNSDVKEECGKSGVPSTHSLRVPAFLSIPSATEPSSGCNDLSPSLLACLDDFVHVPRWPNLEDVAIRQRRMLADELYS